MGIKLTTAERNRRKRERKKRAREEERKRQEEEEKEEAEAAAKALVEEEESKTVKGTLIKVEEGEEEEEEEEEEIVYVSELNVPSTSTSNNGIEGTDNGDDNDIAAVLRRFQARAGIIVSDDDEKIKQEEERGGSTSDVEKDSDLDSDDEDGAVLSKRKQREASRPTVAELKNRVDRADLVEAHDVTAADPDMLLLMKAVLGTVPVPRHWGRKRKYLQGKRGIEKPPFQLPDFIAKTGISDVRGALDDEETDQTIRKKNRNRVNPNMGALDVDYRTLHDAFFKHQNRQSIRVKLTKMGDLYYEGKEFETNQLAHVQVGGELSSRLKEALGMVNDTTPPPWIINMQRYGPPPSYPNLKIPGLNAPLPKDCSYGYHVNGWGKPPVDAFGRPLYGGNPFDPPGSSGMNSTTDWDFDATSGAIITSDGKTIGRKPWGALPGDDGGYSDGEEDEEESEEESSEEEDGDMDESSEEEGEEVEDMEKKGVVGVDGAGIPTLQDGIESVLPASAVDLRKQGGDETPAPPKQLYTVLQQKEADKDKQTNTVFQSDVTYDMPGAAAPPPIPEGAESVLSKAVSDAGKRKRSAKEEDDDAADLGKKFKF